MKTFVSVIFMVLVLLSVANEGKAVLWNEITFEAPDYILGNEVDQHGWKSRQNRLGNQIVSGNAPGGPSGSQRLGINLTDQFTHVNTRVALDDVHDTAFEQVSLWFMSEEVATGAHGFYAADFQTGLGIDLNGNFPFNGNHSGDPSDFEFNGHANLAINTDGIANGKNKVIFHYDDDPNTNFIMNINTWYQALFELDLTADTTTITIFDSVGTQLATHTRDIINSPAQLHSMDHIDAIHAYAASSSNGTLFVDNIQFGDPIIAACDFDGGGCGLSDINLLMLQADLTVGLAVGENNMFDLNNDNNLDEGDITEWLSQAGASRGYSSAFLRGDTDDLDIDFDPNMVTRTVDISDFQNFLVGFTGVGSTWEVGNFNGDSVVDITDFSNHFLQGFAAASGGSYGPGQSIPEPSTVLLLGLGALLLCYLGWGRI